MKISLPFFMKNAHESYISGLEMIGIPLDRIPKVDEMDKKLDDYKWGGYWAWDPVETGSLLPWICLVMLLHLRTRPGKTPDHIWAGISG